MLALLRRMLLVTGLMAMHALAGWMTAQSPMAAMSILPPTAVPHPSSGTPDSSILQYPRAHGTDNSRSTDVARMWECLAVLLAFALLAAAVRRALRRRPPQSRAAGGRPAAPPQIRAPLLEPPLRI